MRENEMRMTAKTKAMQAHHQRDFTISSDTHNSRKQMCHAGESVHNFFSMSSSFVFSPMIVNVEVGIEFRHPSVVNSIHKSLRRYSLCASVSSVHWMKASAEKQRRRLLRQAQQKNARGRK
jgi:hypothetical protein